MARACETYMHWVGHQFTEVLSNMVYSNNSLSYMICSLTCSAPFKMSQVTAARLLWLDSSPHRPNRCSTQLRNSRSDKRRQRRRCYFSGCWLLGWKQDVLQYHGKSWQATQDPDGDGSSPALLQWTVIQSSRHSCQWKGLFDRYRIFALQSSWSVLSRNSDFWKSTTLALRN